MSTPTSTNTRASIEVQRIIGHVKGHSPGPTLIFFGGIHGNEPAGIDALKRVFSELENTTVSLFGEFFGIAGNLSALAKGVRFVNEDLNRIWLPHRIRKLSLPDADGTIETQEMYALNQLILEILETASPPFYFIDLHTTSGKTEPFIVMNDSLLNRRFTKNFPLPCILGIEEYLTGALLSHINEMGYVAFGFESGQHTDAEAVTNAEWFIKYTLGLTGFYEMDNFSLKETRAKLNLSNTPKRFFEIYHQHLIQEDEEFSMLPGFVNLQTVSKGVDIATSYGELITTKKSRQLFMPLYQDKGYEGFYFIRSVPHFFLWISKYLRKIKADSFLAILPGIQWATSKKDTLFVNKRVARFFAKSIFHLLGYRTREVDEAHFVLKNRERNSKSAQYKRTPWY